MRKSTPSSTRLRCLPLLALGLASLQAAPPPVDPAFPHDQTFVPGQLLYRQVDLGRNGHLEWHNGALYSSNVGGGDRREFKFANPSDPGSLYITTGNVPAFAEHDTHGHTKVGDWLGRQIKHTGTNVNSLNGDRREGFTQPRPANSIGPRSRHHTVFYPWAVPFNWDQYGDTNGWGWIYRGDQLLHEWDMVGQTGIVGNSILLGNLLFIVSNESTQGIAALDIAPLFETPARDPIVLDVLSGNLGAYLAAVWENYIILARRDIRALQMIDISDPTDLRLVATIPMMSNNSNVPYVQFQDQYAFVWGNKINLETRTVELVVDALGTGEPEAGFESTFLSRPSGSVNGSLDVSQYNLPLGNLLVTGGYSTTGRDGIGIWVHQAAPDTQRPYVGYHVPTSGQTNFPLGAPISIVIHETLESPTIINGDTVILRQLGTTTPIDCWVSFSHDDVLTLTPRNYLAENTTYEVVVVDGGIKDVSGNGIEPYTFTFSTGNTAGGNLSPDITDFTPTPARTQAGQTITFTADVTDPEDDPVEYRFFFGDGSPATAWSTNSSVQHSYAANGHYEVKVQARDLKPGGATSQVVTTRTVSIVSPAPAVLPTKSSPLVLDAASRRIYTVNPDNDSISVVHADTHALIQEIDLAALLGPGYSSIDPRNLALDASGQLWVSCLDADGIAVLNAATGALISFIDTGYGSAPVGVLANPAGTTLFVTLEGRGTTDPSNGSVVRYSAATRLETGRRELGPWPRAMAMTANGGRLLVTRFISAENFGQVWEVNPSTMALTRTIPLYRDRGDRQLDGASAGKGVPNYVASITISPDNEWAWYTAHKANTQRGLFFENGAATNQELSPDGTVRALVGRISLSSNDEPDVTRWADSSLTTKRLDVDNSDSPTAVTFTPEGDYAFVTLQGNNSVVVYDIFELLSKEVRNITWRLPAGAAPQGILFDPVTDQLFVKNFLSRDLSVTDLNAFLEQGERSSTETRVSTVTTEKLSAEVFLGKQLFYHASDQMSMETYISCATCHVDGMHDGRVYDFTQRGEGFRNTTDLRGRAGTGHGNVHWTANFDEVQDFILDIMNQFGGSGFLPEGESPHASLSTPNAGRSSELDALAAYVTSLNKETLPRSPHREADGTLTPDAILGAQIFNSQSCTTCHAPSEQFTSGETANLIDIGTLRTSSGQRLGGTLTGIDTPTLLGTWNTAPWFHDGSAETIEDVFVKTGGTIIQAETGALSSTNTSVIQRQTGGGVIINYDASAQGEFIRFMANDANATYSSVNGGSGGTGAIELRYEASNASSFNVIVNGVTHSISVSGDTTRLEWRRAYLPGINLAAGPNNTIVIRSTSSNDFKIDSFTVSTADNLALADPHRRVLDLTSTEQAQLIEYILQLDSSTPTGNTQPVIATTTLDDATEHEAYLLTLDAIGGDGTRSWAVASGALPPGLSLSAADGEITGVPTDFGTFAFSLSVSDADGDTDFSDFTLSVAAGPVGGLPPTDTTLAAAADRSSQGGATTGTDETIPVSLYSRYTVKFNLPDNTQPSQAILRLYRSSSSSAAIFSAFETGDAWTESTSPADTTALIASSLLSSGGLEWVEINVTNYVQAEAVADGIVSFTIKTDQAGWISLHTRENSVNPPELVLTYAPISSAPYLTSLSLPDGVQGQPYSASLTASGGAAPLTWSLLAAPAGIVIDPVTGALSGTPTVNGSVSLTARVTDDDDFADEHSYSFNLTASGYSSWSAGHSWPGDPAATSLTTADPDADGLSNLLEYALGGDPLSAASAPAPSMQISPTSISLSYTRARAELTYAVEASQSLSAESWSTTGVVQDTTTPVGGTATATHTLGSDPAPRLFLRLKVTQ